MSDTENIGDLIINDLETYSAEKTAEIKKAARKIQSKMLSDITADSPVRDYPHNNGVVMKIVASRGKNSKARKERAAEKYQPGYFKKGWKRQTLKDDGDRYVIGVRNKNMPMAVHLLNFGHESIVHKKRNTVTPFVKGSGFSDKVQDKYMDEFGREIEKILEK